MKPKIAFIGLGIMGSAMAANIYKAGFPLTVWNRSRKPLKFIENREVALASTPAEAVRNVDFILYSLSDNTAIEQVVFGPKGIMKGAGNGQLAINLSTIHPDMSHREASAYKDINVGYLDAPVFGSRAEAEDANLCIVVGGEKSDYERAAPIFKAISSSTYYMGDTGKGASMGLIGSLMVCMQLQALCEGLILAKKAKLDTSTVVEILGIPDFSSPIFTRMGSQIIQQQFEPVFSLSHLHKDVKHILQLAEQLGVTLHGCANVHLVIKKAISHGWGAENASAIIKAFELPSAG